MKEKVKLRPGELATLRSIHREELRTGEKYLTKKGLRAIRKKPKK